MKHAPATFDPYRLVRERGVLEGTLDLASSDRLADRLSEHVAPGNSTVAWRIEGTTDRAGRPALAVSIAGSAALTCQRCLGEMAHSIARTTVTVLAKSESDADVLDADSADEVLVADRPLDPVNLVEDELLLTLPYAPMHEPDACVGRA
jgi:uncharacterized protein